MKSKNQFADIENAREPDQIKVMERIVNAQHCPFCPDQLALYHKMPTLKETEHWILTSNQWPYPNTKLHLLAIYKKHATVLSDLNPEAGSELIELMQWAEKKYEMPGGAFSMRFGDTDYSAGSVAHIHVQLLVPDIHSPNFEKKPVKITVGKTLEEYSSVVQKK